jgi:hypothetical protein
MSEQMSPDFARAPVVIVQSRALLIFGLGFWLLCFVIGLTMPWRHYMLDGLIPAEWILIPGSAGLFLVTAIAAMRPARITLSQDRFEYRFLLSDKKIAWSQIGSIGFWSHRGVERGVTLLLRNGQRINLAGGWPIPMRDLANRLEAARRSGSRSSF